MLVMVAGAALLVGCAASETPPGAGFGVEVIQLTERKQTFSTAPTNLYLLVAGDECRLSAKMLRAGKDRWSDLGEVDCAAALALFGADR